MDNVTEPQAQDKSVNDKRTIYEAMSLLMNYGKVAVKSLEFRLRTISFRKLLSEKWIWTKFGKAMIFFFIYRYRQYWQQMNKTMDK